MRKPFITAARFQQVAMPLKPKEEQSHSAVRGVVFFLCVSIFAWGLHAKLSAYKSPEGNHSRPVAKLVQDDPAAKRSLLAENLARRGTVLVSAAVATLIVAPRLAMPIRIYLREAEPASLQAFAYALRFRPPPSAI